MTFFIQFFFHKLFIQKHLFTGALQNSYFETLRKSHRKILRRSFSVRLQLHSQRTSSTTFLSYEICEIFQKKHFSRTASLLLGLFVILPLFSKQLHYFFDYSSGVALLQPCQNNNYLTKQTNMQIVRVILQISCPEKTWWHFSEKSY